MQPRPNRRTRLPHPDSLFSRLWLKGRRTLRPWRSVRQLAPVFCFHPIPSKFKSHEIAPTSRAKFDCTISGAIRTPEKPLIWAFLQKSTRTVMCIFLPRRDAVDLRCAGFEGGGDAAEFDFVVCGESNVERNGAGGAWCHDLGVRFWGARSLRPLFMKSTGMEAGSRGKGAARGRRCAPILLCRG